MTTVRMVKEKERKGKEERGERERRRKDLLAEKEGG